MNPTLLERLKALPWWVSTLVMILAGALQIIYPLYVSGTPITTNQIIGAIITALVGFLIPSGEKKETPAK
jgi:uncharacterized membrane protein